MSNIKIRPFKRLEKGSHSSTLYAVTGAVADYDAIMAVLRYKKESVKHYDDFFCTDGIIAPYKDENGKKWDGLYLDEKVKGKKCLIVSR